MIEVFEIISAVNRLKDSVVELSTRFESFKKFHMEHLSPKYLDEESACKRIFASPRTLAKLRKAKKIAYTQIHNKNLYKTEDLDEYLESNGKKY